MSTRVELEAARARTEADWRRANDDLVKARAKLAEANAGWDKVVADRRQADTDRRRSDTVWDRTFPDRRKAGSERRISAADIAAFSQTVTERHGAYVYRSKAEADCAAAQARLNAASAQRDKIITALDALNRVQRRA